MRGSVGGALALVDAVELVDGCFDSGRPNQTHFQFHFSSAQENFSKADIIAKTEEYLAT